jgi:hypothetical protein
MLVKVWNDNNYPFTDPDFYGELVTIKPHTFIMMDYDRAVDFRGKYSPPMLDGGGGFIEASFKKIRVEQPSLVEVKPTKDDLKCQACSKEFMSEKDLLNHIRAEHMQQWCEETKEDMNKAESETKRGPGRPAKKAEVIS